MNLRTKIVALAVAPLLIALVLVALAVRHQEHDLAQRERALIERSYMDQRRSELRSYVELAVSNLLPLYESGQDDEATRNEALRRLASLNYGDDGYFFVYDLEGNSLMHSRQPELVGQNLWELRDSRGRYTIQELIKGAKENGGGYVEYEWRKPSSAQMAPKLGYVTAMPRWNWMVGTGLYLDDIQSTMDTLDRQMNANVTATLLWIAGIAALCLGVVSAAGLLLNLSEHRTAEAKLRLLARRVVQSQEEERGHLARELHDGTSQTLVSAKLLIESAVESLDRQRQPTPPALAKALQRLNDSLIEVRRISHRLRPALLDTLGLPAALERLVDEFREEGGVDASMMMGGESFELQPEVKTALFRLTQEALTNVRKHANAQHVNIALHFDEEEGVRLEVSDDGTGFDIQAVQLDPRRGIGLRNMRERMEAIGGRLIMCSNAGRTSIEAEVPTRSARAAEEAPASIT
ncbi:MULTISPECIES: cache domain-containing protein [Variovorax]|jgi:two-component system NarL family sensor kinase|uniref:cache domain-containing protein n=1 Tax=Variovorax TaxID=34072 RepID=UPI0021AC1D3C|nr:MULTISPECIES: cache domain-containing protein [Variovorax]MDQ0085967.1 two-component system NarL family sensor kinase [Variovorax boronicumulans]UVH59029.1 cache domain-containing protein [Variovorax paradoxus]